MTKSTFATARSLRAIDRISRQLSITPMTADGLTKKVCLSLSSVQKYLAHLQQEPRRVRIRGYEPGIGPTAPIYALGSAPDAKRRKKMSAVDRFKALKADPEKYQRALALRRLCRLRRRAAKAPEGWASALLGPMKQGRTHGTH